MFFNYFLINLICQKKFIETIFLIYLQFMILYINKYMYESFLQHFIYQLNHIQHSVYNLMLCNYKFLTKKFIHFIENKIPNYI